MRNDQEEINLAVTIDRNYLPHVATMLLSAKRHCSVEMKVFVLYDRIERSLLRRLRKILFKHKITTHFLHLDPTPLKTAKISGHISIATYYRLLLASSLPESVQKILFLDADLLIADDILKIWNINLAEHLFAAIPDDFMEAEHRVAVCGEGNSRYFNAGVLLINLKMWRKENFERTCLNYLSNSSNSIRYWDQDVLNHCATARWKALDLRWNAISPVFTSPLADWPTYAHREVEAARQNPAIVHFCGGGHCKPWNLDCVHPWAEAYRMESSLMFRLFEKTTAREAVSRFLRKILRSSRNALANRRST